MAATMLISKGFIITKSGIITIGDTQFLDGDGVINSGKELFGSETLLTNGSKAANDGYFILVGHFFR